MESRYTNRFRSLPQQTGSSLKAYDSAGNLSSHIQNAKGSLNAQKQNISELLSTASEMIAGLTTFQQMHDIDLVKNLPAPTDEVIASSSKQLSYVRLTMRFLQSGLLHFMAQTIEGQERIQRLESLIASLAEYDDELDIIGKMPALEIEHLENEIRRPISPPESVKSISLSANTTTDEEIVKMSEKSKNDNKSDLVPIPKVQESKFDKSEKRTDIRKSTAEEGSAKKSSVTKPAKK